MKLEYKTVEEYLALTYTIDVLRDSAENWSGWFANVIELPGCMTQAQCYDDLDVMVADAMRAWIETAIQKGIPVPEPKKNLP